MSAIATSNSNDGDLPTREHGILDECLLCDWCHNCEGIREFQLWTRKHAAAPGVYCTTCGHERSTQ